MLNRTNRYKKEVEFRNREEKKTTQLNVIQILKEEIVYLKKELEEVIEKKDETDKHKEMLRNLYEQKLIDENGNPIYEEYYNVKHGKQLS